ncbi:lipopolysaccharide export system protein LptA [Pedobacter sp. UYP1]
MHLLHSHKNLKFLRTILLLNFIFLLVLAGHSAFALESFSTRQISQQQDTTKKAINKVIPNSNTAAKIPVGLQQDTAKKDTSKVKVGGAAGAKGGVVKQGDSKIEYSAVDSTKYSKDNSIIYLYGKARVIYQSFELDADYITYNSKTNTVFASGRKDSRGKYLGKPIFKMEKQGSSIADSLFYNTKSGKGTVFNTFTEQEGGFFSGGQSKRQPDNEIHLKGMTYSTCNLPHPHFGIFITKGIVTDKQIITGPVYLKIEDIPLPLGLPFAFFPKPNKRNSGIIMPNVGDDYTRGFFFRDGGYYLNLNDYWDAKILGTLYTRGSYGMSVTSNYVKRYKYNGSIKVDYNSNRYGLEGTPAYEPRKDYSIQWVHSQNANAHPGTNFGASVNIKTSGYNLNTAGGTSYDFRQITENALSSSVSYGRTFADGKVTFSAAARHNQNTQSKTVDVTLPDIALGVQTFPLFKQKGVGEQKWYNKITVGYSMVASNSISTSDSLLFTRKSLDRLKNGFSHTVPVSINFTALKYFNFSAGGTYLEKWQFQSVRQTAIRGIMSNGVLQADQIVRDTIQGFNRSGEYSINMGVSTKIYNTLQFKKMGNLKALRLVMTPNANFSYRPDFSDPSKGNYKTLLYQDGTPVYDPFYGRNKRYSIHEGTLYGGPGEGRNASISFGLDNTLEAKVFSKKDTTGTGMRKVPIIQGLGFNGSYNFLAPAFKLSELSFSGRSQFTDKFGITYDGSFNPYAVADSTINGVYQTKKLVDRYTLPRLTRFSVSFGYSLNAEAFRKRNESLDKTTKKVQQNGMTPEQAAQLAEVSKDPNAFVDFKIPWNFTFSYRFDYSKQATGLLPTATNTLNFNGDFNVTPKWKVQFTSGYDFKSAGLSPTSFAIYRDLHCWDMSINWIPIGPYRSYNLTIKVKASILQDLKLSKQQAYYTRF